MALFGLLLSVFAIGTGWYSLVEGFTPVEALSLSVITLSTVRFQAIHPLDDRGRIVRMCSIVGGIGITAHAATAPLEEVIVSGVTERLAGRSPARRVKRMQQHVIACGFGRVGAEIARDLRDRNIPVVVIEQNLEQAAKAQDIGCLTVVGDATQEASLRDAGVDRARVLIAAADSDVGNTYIVLTARALNSALVIVARAGSDTAQARLHTAGANHVVSPHRIAGRRMALTAVQPLIVDFVDRRSGQPEGEDIPAEAVVGEGWHVSGETIQEAFAGTHGVRVLGLMRRDGELSSGRRAERACAPATA